MFLFKGGNGVKGYYIWDWLKIVWTHIRNREFFWVTNKQRIKFNFFSARVFEASVSHVLT